MSDSSIMGNVLSKTGLTQNHVRLGLPYKSRQSKGLVIGMSVPLDLLTPYFVINRPLSYQSEIQYIWLSIV